MFPSFLAAHAECRRSVARAESAAPIAYVGNRRHEATLKVTRDPTFVGPFPAKTRPSVLRRYMSPHRPRVSLDTLDKHMRGQGGRHLTASCVDFVWER